YAATDQELDKMDTVLEHMDSRNPVPVRFAMAVYAADAVLNFGPVGDPVNLVAAGFWRNYYLSASPLQQMANQLRERADLHVARGLLDLEPGEVDAARREFGDAWAVWGSQDQSASGSGLDFFGRPIAQDMLRRIERAGAVGTAK